MVIRGGGDKGRGCWNVEGNTTILHISRGNSRLFLSWYGSLALGVIFSCFFSLFISG